MFANIPDPTHVGGQALATGENQSQSGFSDISKELLNGINPIHSVSRLSEDEPANKEKKPIRNKSKFAIKGFALGYNAVQKPDPIEMIEERDEEFKATAT